MVEDAAVIIVVVAGEAVAVVVGSVAPEAALLAVVVLRWTGCATVVGTIGATEVVVCWQHTSPG